MPQKIALLKDHGTVVDPTVALQELLADPLTKPVREFEPGIDHLAPQLVDQIEKTGVSAENAPAGAASLAAALEAVKPLHAAGIPIVAGTDVTVPGYNLHREMELYVKAGFTPMEAIQVITIVPARVLGLAKEIVNGDPLSSIADLRKVDTVIAGERVYAPTPLLRSVKFRP